MTWSTIPPHPWSKDCRYLKQGDCYHCCDRCNLDRHQCAGCGESLNHNGQERSGKIHEGCIDDEPYGTVRWFGISWGAPVNDPANQVEVPIGMECIYCEEKIMDERQSGFTLPYSDGVTAHRVAYHRECFLTSMGIPVGGYGE